MEIHKRKISAKIVADSIDPRGNRITTFVLTYPRFIHAELLTHRLFSRNAASSRAIPFKKMVEDIENDPFIPIAWQKDHKGMQGVEYLNKENSRLRTKQWLLARDSAVEWSTTLNSKLETFGGDLIDNGNTVTKQLCNRLLEPFQWYTCLVTATEFDNFFELRCPQYYYEPENKYFKSKKDYSNYWFECFGSGIEEAIEGDPVLWWLNINHSQAEIHIQALAESMWDAMNESIPNQLESGQWHIPFGDKIDYALHKWNFLPNIHELWGKDMSEYGIKVSTARCARLSYMTFDGEIDYEKDIALHNILLSSRHMSPFEHCARAMTNEEYVSFVKGNLDTIEIDEPNDSEFVAYNRVWNHDKEAGWCNNFRGFIQYRYLIENGNFRTYKSI